MKLSIKFTILINSLYCWRFCRTLSTGSARSSWVSETRVLIASKLDGTNRLTRLRRSKINRIHSRAVLTIFDWVLLYNPRVIATRIRVHACARLCVPNRRFYIVYCDYNAWFIYPKTRYCGHKSFLFAQLLDFDSESCYHSTVVYILIFSSVNWNRLLVLYSPNFVLLKYWGLCLIYLSLH